MQLRRLWQICIGLLTVLSIGWGVGYGQQMQNQTSVLTAPKPLYRDPILDGAADVSIVYHRQSEQWLMFYTNRRATLKGHDLKDVAWVHGTPIGIARSKNGLKWDYQGQAKIPSACSGVTLWAPEIYDDGQTYHMWLTIVPGIFHKWGDKAATTHIEHLTSQDLKHWTCSDRLNTGSDRIIDASVYRFGDTYRLWYKDEHRGSRIPYIESTDLVHWSAPSQSVLVDRGGEGPKVFAFAGSYWVIIDVWKGLMVMKSSDGLTWTPQPDRILETPGQMPTDRAKGQHADVVVNNGHAFIYYFVHQGAEPEGQTDPYWNQRTVIQVAELKLTPEGWLSVDRNAPVTTPLVAPKRP